jgi:salicylate hydroxylase
MRRELLQALLETAAKSTNIEVRYGTKTTSIQETESSITITLEDGSTITGDLLLGCDGIHSTVRTLHIEPSRKPVYSGIAVAMSSSPIGPEHKVRFKDTALYSSRRGSLMVSFFEPSRTAMYMAAVMETAEVQSREGWKAKGEDQEVIRKGIMERFGSNAVPELKPLIEDVKEWFLYPVYKLTPKGKWATDMAMLLGDAAHAVSLFPRPRSGLNSTHR